MEDQLLDKVTDVGAAAAQLEAGVARAKGAVADAVEDGIDAAKRALTEKLLRGSGDFHQLFVVASLAHEFERAATSLSRCGPIVRDYVLRTRLSR